MTAAAQLDARSKALRTAIVGAFEAAGRGHLGPAMSLVEILRVLYDDILDIDPANPKAPERDRCILSKGHGCLALYAVLADKGFFPASHLATFCAEDSILGVETSTGALGHGLSIGVGLAVSARLNRRKNRVFVVMGDGEINEGAVWEAAMSAAKNCLDNLTAVIDYNKFQSYGPTRDVVDLEPLADKWRSFGFAAEEVDGHDVPALRRVLSGAPFAAGRPSAVICHTVKGRGIPIAESNADWHHKNKLSPDERAAVRAALED